MDVNDSVTVLHGNQWVKGRILKDLGDEIRVRVPRRRSSITYKKRSEYVILSDADVDKLNRNLETLRKLRKEARDGYKKCDH